MSDARGPLRFRGTLVLRDSALSYRLRRGLNLVSTESGQLRRPGYRALLADCGQSRLGLGVEGVLSAG